MRIRFENLPNVEAINFKADKSCLVATNVIAESIGEMAKSFGKKGLGSKAPLNRDIYKLGLRSKETILKVKNREFSPIDLIKLKYPNIEEIEDIEDLNSIVGDIDNLIKDFIHEKKKEDLMKIRNEIFHNTKLSIDTIGEEFISYKFKKPEDNKNTLEEVMYLLYLYNKYAYYKIMYQLNEKLMKIICIISSKIDKVTEQSQNEDLD